MIKFKIVLDYEISKNLHQKNIDIVTTETVLNFKIIEKHR